MKAALLLALTLLLTACAGGAPPQDSFYRLSVPAPHALTQVALPGIVEVSRFSGEGLVGDRAILYSYRDKPDKVDRYTYHLWIAPPPELLQEQLVRDLRQANAATTVVTADLRVPPDFVIEGRVRRVEQIAGVAPSGVVELELGVVRLRGNALVMLKTYRVEKPVASEQVPESIAGFESAVGEVYAHFLDDLSRLPVEK